MQRSEAAQADVQGGSVDQGEPSIGPACGFFFMAVCALISVFVIGSAWFMFSNQSERASIALRKQLIPWVEDSLLSENDKQSIVERLNELVSDMETNRLNEGQLSRLNFRLSGAPIFQWGVVEKLIEASQKMDALSENEKEALVTEFDRLLRTVMGNRLAMEQLEFITQKVAVKEVRSGKLSLREGIQPDDVREAIRRASELNDRVGTSREPLEKTPSQVFRIIVDEALQANE